MLFDIYNSFILDMFSIVIGRVVGIPKYSETFWLYSVFEDDEKNGNAVMFIVRLYKAP